MLENKRVWEWAALVSIVLIGLLLVEGQKGFLQEQPKRPKVTIHKVKGLEVDTVVTAAAVDNESNIWIGTRNGVKVHLCQPGSWLEYTRKDGLPDNYITAIVVDTNNAVWVGTKHGLAKFDGASWTAYTTENTNGGLTNNNIAAVAIDGENNVWFGTENGGVCLYNASGEWHNFTTKDGLINNTVWSIAVDDENMIWFGTPNGVSKYDREEWTAYTLEGDELVDDMVFSIVAKNNYLWFGTASGVSAFDTESERWTSFDTLRGTTVTSIASRDQDIWFGTSGDGVYLYEFKDNNWTRFTKKDGLVDNIVTSIVIDASDEVWVGTYGRGISVLGMERQ